MSGVLLYDGDCGFCTTVARWLKRLVSSPAKVEPLQHVDLAPLGLSEDSDSEAVQWIDDGRRAVGPEAVAAYLQTGTRPWRTAGRVLTAPGSKQVAWPAYRWLAHHRELLPGGTPASELPRLSTPVKGIRRRRPKDLSACARLLRVVFGEGQYPVTWPDAPRAWLDGEEVMDAWVVDQLGEILGHVAITRVDQDPVSALRWREDTGHEPTELAGISRLFVRPRVRRQGIGTALLHVAVAEARARGLLPVLEVTSRSSGAIQLFDERGWRLLAMYSSGNRHDKLETYFYAAPDDY